MLLLLPVAACKGKDKSVVGSPSAAASVPGRFAVTTAGRGDSKVQANRSMQDSDIASQGHGLPKGYIAQLDQPTAEISNMSYTADGNGRWEVRTGPAHILYSPKDMTQKVYSVTATFEQLEKPMHPEAYGIFIGGSALDVPAKRRYTYFLVRGNGQYLVKVRNGATTRTITDWVTHPAIPREDAAGKALYGIKIDVDGKVAKVSVNGQPVTTISAKSASLEGIIGIRVNHNLHVIVTSVSVLRTR
jgi:hypothetical protein